VVQIREFLNLLTAATLFQSGRRLFVGNHDGEWQTPAKSDLPIEHADCLSGAKPKFVQHAFGTALRLGLNASVYDGCFHPINVSLLQHSRKFFVILANVSGHARRRQAT
jgi:hypothetical protein